VRKEKCMEISDLHWTFKGEGHMGYYSEKKGLTYGRYGDR
jgi:hypothetical protein